LELRVDGLAIHDNLESAAGGRHEREPAHFLLERDEDLRRQTDGLRLIVSSRAIGEFHLHALTPVLKATGADYSASPVMGSPA
jgi:hypothetical protein